MSPENRKTRRKKAEARFQRYCEQKKANIAANSPSRRVWYPFAGEIQSASPEPRPT